jgi:hypothetical protein
MIRTDAEYTIKSATVVGGVPGHGGAEADGASAWERIPTPVAGAGGARIDAFAEKGFSVTIL